VFSLEIRTEPGARDLLIAELWEHGCAGITELDDSRLRAFFEDAAQLDSLEKLYPQAVFRAEEARDWAQAARDLLVPMEAGTRFFLVPEWRDDPTPAGRFRIKVNPGMAFGTGVHETTRLCLEALEDYLKPGMTVLDVGTGSGILGEAAGLLGAGAVFACDTDPIAAGIAHRRLAFTFAGSVEAVHSAAADLMLANISPEVLVELAPEFRRSLRPGGVLLASGFETHEAALVEAALGRAREMRTKANWALAVIRK
jgi:ribosomal protein L11 methyltransferase